MTVSFNSTGLAAGSYSASLCVTSNDPDSGPGNGTNLVVVPVTLTVQQPSISLLKTVGTNPGECATTSALTVPHGTTVYYCYTVTNTGNVTLNLHDLVDDQLGAIFSGFSYSLTPAASVNTVAASLSIPAVMTTRTTNTGIWTAYNLGPTDTAVASASATVTVLLPAHVSGTKTVIGTFSPLGVVTSTIVLTNAGPGPQPDNSGAEFVDTVPSQLTATGASASAGAITRVGNTISWNGSLAAGGTVTITITASVKYVFGGTVVSNQGTIFCDAAGNGSNGATRLTDDPNLPGASDPTNFTVLDLTPIPTLHGVGVLSLVLLLGVVAVLTLRRLS